MLWSAAFVAALDLIFDLRVVPRLHPKRRRTPHSKGGTIVNSPRIVSIDSTGGSVASVSSGAGVATGPVKLAKLANAPLAPFMPRPKVDEVALQLAR